MFEFTSEAAWRKFESLKPELEIVDERLLDASSTPRINATLLNKTINKYGDIEVVAIVYDQEGNAAAASKTLVDVLYPNSEVPVSFTWPLPFGFQVSKIEIIPKLPI